MKNPDCTVNADLGADTLFVEVYDRLKQMARRQRVRAGGSLSTTEIVHELYLRMGIGGEKHFARPMQFFAYAARAMRHLLVDSARRRMQIRLGGDQRRLSMTDPAVASAAFDPRLALELDDALTRLEADDQRAAQVVELHYFGGLAIAQIAELFDVALRTVDRDLRYARSFLAVHLPN